VINAYAASVGNPATKFLLFDSQIFFFCNLLSKIVATSQPIINVDGALQTSVDPQLVAKHLDENDEPVLRLKQLLEASLYSSPSDTPAYLPKPPYIAIMKYLSDRFDHYKQLENFIASGQCGELFRQETNSLFHSPDVIQSFEPMANEILKQLAIEGEYRSPLPTELPTRYDNPFSYKILSDLVDALKETCQELGIAVPCLAAYLFLV
jgi:hypothetical protein